MKRILDCFAIIALGAGAQLACGSDASNPPSDAIANDAPAEPTGTNPAPSETSSAGAPTGSEQPSGSTTQPPTQSPTATSAPTEMPTMQAAGAAGTPSPPPGGTGGAGGTGGVPPAGGAVLFSDDFESGSSGQAPAGWDTFISWVPNGSNPNGQNQALITDTDKHGGTKSVHIMGGQNPAMITKPLPAGTNRVYVRAWIKMTRQLGMNPDANHETLIGIRGEPGSANNEVRFGEIKGVIGTNEVPSDNISPKQEQWGKGPTVPANEWACFEVAFLADQPNHELAAWVNGQEVHRVNAPEQWQNGELPANWMDGKFNEVILGWHSFSSAEVELWLDDVVVSTVPVGC